MEAVSSPRAPWDGAGLRVTLWVKGCICGVGESGTGGLGREEAELKEEHIQWPQPPILQALAPHQTPPNRAQAPESLGGQLYLHVATAASGTGQCYTARQMRPLYCASRLPPQPASRQGHQGAEYHQARTRPAPGTASGLAWPAYKCIFFFNNIVRKEVNVFHLPYDFLNIFSL